MLEALSWLGKVSHAYDDGRPGEKSIGHRKYTITLTIRLYRKEEDGERMLAINVDQKFVQYPWPYILHVS